MGKPKLTLRSCKRTQRYTPRPVVGHHNCQVRETNRTVVTSVKPGVMKPKQNAKCSSATRTRLTAQSRSRYVPRLKPDKTEPVPRASSGHNTASSNQNTASSSQNTASSSQNTASSSQDTSPVNTASSSQNTASSSQNTSPVKSFHDSYKLYVNNNSPEKSPKDSGYVNDSSSETDRQPRADTSKESSDGQISPLTSENDNLNRLPGVSKRNVTSKNTKLSKSKQKWNRSRNARKRDFIENMEGVSSLDSVHETQKVNNIEKTSQDGPGEGSSSLDISAREKTRVKHNEGRVSVSHASVQVNMASSKSLQVCIDRNTNMRVIGATSTPVKTLAELNTNIMSDISLTELVKSELKRQKLAESHQTYDDQTMCDCTGNSSNGVATDVAVSPKHASFFTDMHESSTTRADSPPVLMPILHSILTSSDSESGNTAGPDSMSEEETNVTKKCYPLRHQKPTLVQGTLPEKWRKRPRQPEQKYLSLQTGSKRTAESNVEDPVLSKKQKQTWTVTDCSTQARELKTDNPSADKTWDNDEDTSLGNFKDCNLSCISRRMSPKGDASFVPVLQRMSDAEMSPVKQKDIQTLLPNDSDNKDANNVQGENMEIRGVEAVTTAVKVSVPQGSLEETVVNIKKRMSGTRHGKNQNTAEKEMSAMLPSQDMSPVIISEAVAATVPPFFSDPEDEAKDSMDSVKDGTDIDSSDLEKGPEIMSHDESSKVDNVKQKRSSTRNRRKQKPKKKKGTDFNITKLSEQLDQNLTLDQESGNPISVGSAACSGDVLCARCTPTFDSSSDALREKDENGGSSLCVLVDTDVNSSMVDIMQLSPLIPPCSEVDDFREICEVVNEQSSLKDVDSEISQKVSVSNSFDDLEEETEDPLVNDDEKSNLASLARKGFGKEVALDFPKCESGDRGKSVIRNRVSSPGEQTEDACQGDSVTCLDGDDSGLCLLADTRYKNGEKMGIVDYSSSEEDEKFEDQQSKEKQKVEVSSGLPEENNGNKVTEDEDASKKLKRHARVRGKCGWEESLRQRPAKTKLFQVGEYDSTATASSRVKADSEGTPASSEEKEDKSHGRIKMEVSKPKALTRQNSSENEKPLGPVKTSPTKKCDARPSSTSPTKKRGESSPKNKVPEAVVLEDDEELARVVEIEPNYGRLVWARLSGERWWPGMVIKGTLIYLQSERSSSSWIYWFGDHKVSQVSRDKILPFSENYMLKIGSFKSKIYRKAILEALVECSRRSGVCVDTNNDTKLLQWADASFPSNVPGKTADSDPEPDCPIPESVMSFLREIGKDIRKKVAHLDFRNDNMDRARENAVDAVRKGDKELKDVCIACSDLGQPVKLEHPLFEGGLCAQCQNEVVETMYAVGDDGLHSFCAVCGAGGDLFVCDSPECKRVYCRPCVEELGGEAVLNQVIVASKWQCFLCSPHKNHSECLLHPRSDWQERVIMFFDTGYRVQVPSLDYFKTKRPLRVLSLYDGIGSGKLTLDQMGFKVDVYYASEVEQDAIVVTQCNHGSSVTQVGDVKMLDYKELQEMTPIDLLIGGSPCNDLSLANPNRRGFQECSTALLFFEFVRIRDRLQELNGNTHLFWLYENVASMKTDFKNTMSRFLSCQPALWDSKYMSAQRRGRYFWGNIPGMYSTPAISTHMHEDVDLNSVLEQNLDRHATIGKMGCVTTRSNSLKHGKNDELFPVEMKGEASGIWIPEVERLFGYPPHYTDVGNLPVTRRHKLLGKSWSIPIIKQIFAPLKRYFATDDKQ